MTNGRSPRIRLASVSIFSSDAPTCGARSILLMTRRSDRVMPGPPFRGDLVAGRDVDDVNREVGEFGREGGGEIVAAGFDQHHVEIGKFRAHVGDRGEIHRGVLADRGVRAAAGLDAGDAIRRQRSRAHQKFGVPFGVDVVGDGGDVVALAHRLAEQIHQRGFSRSDGATDADAKRAVRVGHVRGAFGCCHPRERETSNRATLRFHRMRRRRDRRPLPPCPVKPGDDATAR